MDYQASTRLRKIITRKLEVENLRIVLLFAASFLLACAPTAFAQLAPNPLTADVVITALVLPRGVNPDTPPIPPGPIPNDINDAIIFKGIAYPKSTISILKNGIVIAELLSKLDGTFEIRIKNLAPGTYSYGIRAEDKDKLKSKLLVFTVFVSQGIATVLEGIFIPPTITSDYIEVKKGEVVTFSGSSVPNSEVRLSFQSSVETLKKTMTNASGTWMFVLDSSQMDRGDYSVKGRSLLVNNLSLYSDPLTFRVGDVTRVRSKASALNGFRKKCDLNDDGRVNLLDFSIMAYWYKRLGFPMRVDLNTDAKVNLTDLSILAYCWTG